jgi:hypothetical protein
VYRMFAGFEAALPQADDAAARVTDVLRLMATIGGCARVSYVRYTGRVTSECEFARLCAFLRCNRGVEGAHDTVIPRAAHHAAPRGVPRGAPRPRGVTKTRRAAAAAEPLTFTLKGAGPSGRAAVRIGPSDRTGLSLAVSGHIDARGIAGVNARIERIVTLAASYLAREADAPDEPRVAVEAIGLVQVYWFLRSAVDVDRAFAALSAAIATGDPVCPWESVRVDAADAPRRHLRLSSPGTPPALSATVQPCGTISLVSRSAATLRRAALHLAEILPRITAAARAQQ